MYIINLRFIEQEAKATKIKFSVFGYVIKVSGGPPPHGL